MSTTHNGESGNEAGKSYFSEARPERPVPPAPLPRVQRQYVEAVLAMMPDPTEYQKRKLHLGRAHELFVGPYLLLGHFAKGAMGTLYLGFHRQTRERRVLKLFPKRLEHDETALRLMKREARVGIQLRHPNIVRTYSVAMLRPPYYIAMEYVEGRGLDEILRERKYLSGEQAVPIVRAVTHALEAVRRAGAVHGDIKPANTLISKTGKIKLADFGLAHFLGDNEGFRRQGYVLGTGHYVAPEVASRRRGGDIRSDLYSLGVMFFEMVTGIVPYPASTRSGALERHQFDAVPDPCTHMRDLPVPIGQVIVRLIDKDPERRYQTPVGLLQALTDLGPLGVGKPV